MGHSLCSFCRHLLIGKVRAASGAGNSRLYASPAGIGNGSAARYYPVNKQVSREEA